ncbi:MAG: ATP-dependent helicase [Chloroflexota bacterium]
MAPELEGEARDAVLHRGGDVQIIASAGSGKTEVVAQRIVSLLEEEVEPGAIVAFTFTEKAAASLAARVQQRASERLGEAALGKLGPLYIGTIHAYCFRLLQQFVARYEAYDVLDENQLAAFLAREGRRLKIKQLDPKGRLFAGISTFLTNAEVVENELLDVAQLSDPFRGIYSDYLERLDDFRVLSFGQLISHAVTELENPETRAAVREPLRHLIVDEYQDVNPAQERLIELLAGEGVELCVVGDDDQAIYQWRGTDVQNIIEFAERYPDTKKFTIAVNRRSRPAIIETANRCSGLIEGRLKKEMNPYRDQAENCVVYWRAEDESEQAAQIAAAIKRAHAAGYRYRDMAVLIRGRSSLGEILDTFVAEDVPVLPGGRTNLFLQQDAQTFGRLCAYLAGHEWRSEPWGPGHSVSLNSLMKRYRTEFDLDRSASSRVRKKLRTWHDEAHTASAPANLVRDFYELLELLGVGEWDHEDESAITRLGALARCTQILADFESMRYRARVDPENPGEIIGGQDRGEWHYRWLAIYVQNYAQGAYEDFDGQDVVPLDAVELTTVHKAKGLEWPLVFIPSVIGRRFPSSRVGKPRTEWHVPTELFDESRYNGSLNDERRLFYVALTRACDQVLVSSFSSYPSGKSVSSSPLLEEVFGDQEPIAGAEIPAPPPTLGPDPEEELVEVALSDLQLYDSCGMSFRLRTLLGFQPVLARELGYGRAVHHIMRAVAEHVQRTGDAPDQEELGRLFDEEFFLPLATKAAHREMKERARRHVQRFLDQHADELRGMWAVERPFELRTSDALISGRADVILDQPGDGDQPRLTIIDYKTANPAGRDEPYDPFEFQLQVYGEAGNQEGLSISGAYVQDLVAYKRIPVAVDSEALQSVRAKVDRLVAGLKRESFEPSPGVVCGQCDVSPICRHSARKAKN